MPLKVLIVDDEYPSRQELRCIFEEITNIEVVGECRSGEEAYRMADELDINVVFLDIQMKTMHDGLITAERIMKMSHPPKIVFTTGYSEFAVKAFELEAVDYVLKPYSRERLELTVERLTRDAKAAVAHLDLVSLPGTGCSSDQTRLAIWHDEKLLVLQASEIFFVRAEQKRKTFLCTEKGDFITTMPLLEVQQRLANAGFFRTHKSFLVNLRKVREIIPWFNGTYILSLEGCMIRDIPVAKHFIQGFKSAIGIN